MVRAIKAFGPGDLRVVEVGDPIPGNGDVLIDMKASGICGSDKWFWRVQEPSDYIAGHEAAGEVVGVGSGVKHLRVGDRVAVNNVVGCGVCPACRSGRFVLCPNRLEDVGNGFAEMAVAPERNCLKLKDGIPYEAACLIFDNWGTPYCAVERGGIVAGDDVLVLGCGPIGLGAIALAKLKGAYVIAADTQEYRLEAALGMGADSVIIPDAGAPEAVRGMTEGAGVRVVLECSGKAPAYFLGMDALRIGGTLVCVGEGADLPFKPSDQVIRKHLSLVGTWYSGMPEGVAIQEMMLRGLIRPDAFVTHRVGFGDIPEAMRTVCECVDGVLKTVILRQ